MSCRELERLFVAGAGVREQDTHRAGCASCETLGKDLEEVGRLVSNLKPPAASPLLRQALLSLPRRTVSCEAADRLIALSVDDEIAAEDKPRLQFHLSRCGACAAAAATLGVARELAPPEPAPWLRGRLAASRAARRRPVRERGALRWLLDPKAAIGLAYAAAVVVMLAGFNPADLARKAGVGQLEESTKAAVSVARNSLIERIGAFEERAARKLAVWKGRAGGYGRAALSTAIQLVM
ncbi:MAG: zf-HC2 domain-containing protein, partial [Thermoanaerobaculia bacterium]